MTAPSPSPAELERRAEIAKMICDHMYTRPTKVSPYEIELAAAILALPSIAPAPVGVSDDEATERLAAYTRGFTAGREYGQAPVGVSGLEEAAKVLRAYEKHRLMYNEAHNLKAMQAALALVQSPPPVPAPDGWALVPSAATPTMLNEVWNSLPEGTVFHNCTPGGMWRAMIAAAPQPPVHAPKSGADEASVEGAFEAWWREHPEFSDHCPDTRYLNSQIARAAYSAALAHQADGGVSEAPTFIRAYPDEECGCPVEEWSLRGVDLLLHFEADGTMEAFADTGDWDDALPLKSTTMEAARAEAFAWINSLPTEDEIAP